MPAPSQLAIATSSLLRLLKEEASYFDELKQQEVRISKLEDEKSSDENAEFQMQQERRALEETKAVFPPLRQRIMAAAAELELKLNEGNQVPDEVSKANGALEQAKKLQD